MRLEPAKRSHWILPIVAVLLVASARLGGAAEPETPQAQSSGPGENRKASSPEAPAQAARRPVREPAFELIGVVKLEGAASFALLLEPELTMGRPLLIRQGQSVGDYQLVSVEDHRVRLESASGLVTVLFGSSKGSPGAIALVAPPKPGSELRQVPNEPSETPPSPAVTESQGARWESTATAKESVEAAMRGTRGEKVLNTLKNAFGLGAKQ